MKRSSKKGKKHRPSSAPTKPRTIFVPRPSRDGAPAVEGDGSSSSRRNDVASSALSEAILRELQSQRKLIERLPSELFNEELKHSLTQPGMSNNNQIDHRERRNDYESKTSANYSRRGSSRLNEQNMVQRVC